MSSPHKPRGKTNGAASDVPAARSPKGSALSSGSKRPGPQFPLIAFLWPARTSTSQWITLPLILMAVGLFRWAVGLWGYSGLQVPPMHGDFEAQRHWMEITSHLPISKWYSYDLEYWGLDYPPLTAYHSYLLGKIGSLINPSWFALDSSRGIETPTLKVFMRATALASEYLAYVPAAIVLNRHYGRLQGVSTWESSVALVAILMQPATMLIDHGHFQYNTVMLGLVLATASSFLADRLLWGCVFFVAALSFKQMALYYAPAIFAYLLGVCLYPRLNVLRFLAIATVTILSFGLVFAPLLLGATYEHLGDPASTNDQMPPYLLSLLLSKSPIALDEKSLLYVPALHLAQVVHRIFPLARGLFEDKVANVWCALHTVYKLHHLPVEFLSRVSLLATLAAIAPACLIIFHAPRKALLLYALSSCAWGFFLLSFQVHEKSVLLPLLPMTMLLGAEHGLGPEIRAWVGWANMLGTWTLLPLLKRDGLRVPYAVLTLLWAYLLDLPPISPSLYLAGSKGVSTPTAIIHLAFYALLATWHLVEAFVPPPQGKPDLWVVLNCVIGAAGFAICYLWCTWQLVRRSGILEYHGKWGVERWIGRAEGAGAKADGRRAPGPAKRR